METFIPPTVTVDANLIYGIFSRYILIAMHAQKLYEGIYSNRVWGEASNALSETAGLSEDQINNTRGHLEHAGFRREELTDNDQEKIDLLKHVNEKDQHVLYLAFITKSKFLVTADKKFRREGIHHEDHQRLGFYYPVEAVSLDKLLCYLMEECEDRHKSINIFLKAIKQAMGFLPKTNVDEIFGWMEEQCPDTYYKLRPRRDAIKDSVEEIRARMLSKAEFRRVSSKQV